MAWSLDKSQGQLDLTVPDGTQADVVLPGCAPTELAQASTT